GGAGQCGHRQPAAGGGVRPGHVGRPAGAGGSKAPAPGGGGGVVMGAATTQPGAPAAVSGATANPWLIAIVVAFASFMEVLDTTIANVALPYIAGSMGVSEDEASWVVTTYLVANAIVLTASSFLARMLGRKTFFLISLGL